MSRAARDAQRSSVGQKVAIMIAAVILIGLMSTVVQIITVQAPVGRWPHMAAGWTAVAAGWIPFFVGCDFVVRRLRGRLTTAFRLAALGLAAVVFQPVWLATVSRAFGGHAATFSEVMVAWLDTNVALLIAIVSTSWAAQRRRYADIAFNEYERLRTRVEAARLHVLTLQLQPHFIFNALNLIAELAYRDPAASAATLGDLRWLLVESSAHAFHGEITLGRELAFIRAYLAIQQRRFRDRLFVAFDIASDVHGAAVPHLVLQPLVENAIVHGIVARTERGAITVSARRAGDRLSLSVTDDGAGLAAGSVSEGMGLANTRLRLEQLYHDDFQMKLAPGDRGRGVVSSVAIPYRELSEDREPEYRGADSWFDESDELSAGPFSAERDRDTPFRTRRRVAILVAVVWLAAAGLWTQIDRAAVALGAPRPSLALSAIVNVVGAMLWMALTPVVAWLARRFDLTNAVHLIRRVCVHLGASLVTACVHLSLWISITSLFVPVTDNNVRRDVVAWAAWDVLAYFAIVGLSVALHLAQRQRARARAAFAAQSDLKRTHMRALRLRLQPRLLVKCLDALAVAVRARPRESEHAIARMGDLLRLLLESATRAFASLDAELALLDAYAVVIGATRPMPAPVRGYRYTVDVPRRHQATIAAVTLAPIAAALGGELIAVDVTGSATTISVNVVTHGDAVDHTGFNELRRRLASTYGHPVVLSYFVENGVATADCHLPRHPSPEDAGDDDESLEYATVETVA